MTSNDSSSDFSIEAELRQSEAQFQTLISANADGIVVVDKHGIVRFVNPAALSLFSRTEDELLGHVFGFPVAGSDNTEVDVRSNTGDSRIAQMRVVPIQWQRTAAYLVSLRDITERKQAEIALQQLNQELELRVQQRTQLLEQKNQQLEASQRQFASLAANVPGAIYQFVQRQDGSRLFTFISSGCRDIYELEPEAITENAARVIEVIHPDDRASFEESVALSAQTLHPWKWEGRIITPSGKLKWLQGIARPQKPCAYEILWDGVLLDITIRKQAETEVAKALQRERELSELKSSFIAMTSHEFRTPLTTITTSAAMLERYSDRLPAAKQQTHLHKIQTSVGRMTQMLDDILLLSKTEAGKLECNPTPIDLGQWCSQLVEELRQSDNHQHQIIFTYNGTNPSELPLLDEKLLWHILHNLLSNGTKYSPEGSTISLNLTCHSDFCTFTVRDEGIGIPSEDLPHLFESFHRAGNIGMIKGTGLGLAIVKQCVDLQHGKISVESVVGKGTTFTVELPFFNRKRVSNSQPQPSQSDCETCSTELEQRLQQQKAEVARLSKDFKQESAKREQIEAALSRSDAQLQTLITKNADGILVIDEQGIVCFINPAALALFDRNEDELLGKLLGFPVVGGDNTEVDVRKKTGENAVAQMRVVAIEWHGQRAYLVTLRDITERKQAEQERLHLLEQAKAANRVKDEFLAVLSHELRTPLNPILGWTKLLRGGRLNEAKQAMALETIEKNASLQIRLIEDLLDISRILRGKLNLDVTSVDLTEIIAAAIETLSLAASAKSIQIETVLEPDVGLISGDPQRLQQVIWNLLSNAIKFTPAGGRVEIHLECVEQQAQIRVKDTGRGISAEFLPYIFDYFRQANSSSTRSVSGLGLGLAIVRHLVELHGGRVEAHSPGEGQGATFIVKLPLLSSSQQHSQDSFEGDGKLDLSNVRILLVEDEEHNRHFLTYLLEDYGAQVEAVASAREALSSLYRNQPDLLVSDIAMPEIDGYTLMRQIKSLPPERGGLVPAIAITAYAAESDRQQALASGFLEHLSKPVNPKELVVAIKLAMRLP